MVDNHKIVIVDDHPMVRQGYRYLLANEADMELIGEAESMSQGLTLVRTLHPELVIIDLTLKDGSGLDLINHIKAHDPDIKMLVASMHDEILYAERVLAAGARGYINKQESPDILITAIRQVLQGRVSLSEAMTNRILEAQVNNGDKTMTQSPLDILSNRELTIFELIGQGKTNKEIASMLSLSRKTVESHKENIKKKLKLESSSDLNRYAMMPTMKLASGSDQ